MLNMLWRGYWLGNCFTAFPWVNCFEAEQCLFVVSNVWTKAFCIHNRWYITSSVGGENLIFFCPFTLTIAVSGLSIQACYLLLPHGPMCACSADGGQWAESTQAQIFSPGSNSLGDRITWKLAKVSFNSDQRLAETNCCILRRSVKFGQPAWLKHAGK